MSTKRSTNGLLRVVLLVLAVIVLFPMLMMVFAFPLMGMMGWWGGYGSMMGDYGGMGLSPLWGVGMMVVFLGVLLAIGYLLYRALVGGASAATPADPALEQLRLAYARGDLSDEEYEERRATLRRDSE